MRSALLKVKEHLAGKLEDYVSEVETEQGITIERWKFLEIFENNSNQYPSIEILPLETKVDYGSPHKPLIEGLSIFDIDIDVSVAGTNPETIEDTVLGYERAVKKVISADETFAGRFLWVLIRSVPFSPLVREARAGALLKILTIGLSARNME